MKTIILSFIFFWNQFLFCQSDSVLIKTDEIIESFLKESDDETENSDLYDFLIDLTKNPIDLNSCDANDLLKIPTLDLFTANKIIEYRDNSGKFFSTSELNLIEEIDKNKISKILPFVKVEYQQKIIKPDQISSFEKIFSKSNFQFRSRIQNDLQTRKAFLDNKYLGSKIKSYTRLLYDYSEKIFFGVTIEKDAGEKSIADYNSIFIQLKNYSYLENLIIGDYSVEFGQGLTLWSPFSFPKGADAVFPVQKKDRNIIPNKSTYESNFFRGAAAEISFKNFNFSFYYSKNNFDAGIDSEKFYSSLPIDGFHRTDNEMQKKKLGEEYFLGSRVDYVPFRNFNLGFLVHNSKFNYSFARTNNIYSIAGNSFTYYSFSYNYLFNKIFVSGEFSYHNNSLALINSAQISFNNSFTFITSIRNYPKNYIGLHSFSFGENYGSTQNEFGIYTGFNWNTFFGEINFYYDQFNFPYSTNSIPLPSKGNEILIDLFSIISNKVQTDLRYKNETSEIKSSSFNIIAARIKQNLRAEFLLTASNKIKLKTRVEFNKYIIEADQIDERGFLFFQDLNYRVLKSLSFQTRIIFFKTDSFNSAVYEFENDLVGIMANLPLYDEGIRWYLVIKYELIEKINCSLKYSETYKPKEKILSTGDSQINNNIDNKLNFQLEINF